MFARVNIVYERRTDALQLPRTAILDADGEQSVFVIANGKAEQRTIRTGLDERRLDRGPRGPQGRRAASSSSARPASRRGTPVKVVGRGTTAAERPSRPTRPRPSNRSCRRRRGDRPGDTSMLSKLIDFAIRRRVTIVMFTVAIALFGFVSLLAAQARTCCRTSPTRRSRSAPSCRAPRRSRSRTSSRGRSRKRSASSATCARCARCRAPASPT